MHFERSKIALNYFSIDYTNQDKKSSSLMCTDFTDIGLNIAKICHAIPLVPINFPYFHAKMFYRDLPVVNATEKSLVISHKRATLKADLNSSPTLGPDFASSQNCARCNI